MSGFKYQVHTLRFLFCRGNVVDDRYDDQLAQALKSLYTPGTKTGVHFHTGMYNNFIRGKLNLSKPPKLLPDRYMLESIVFAFYPEHYLYNVFDRKLQQYIEADLINYNVRAFKENNNPKKYERFEEPFAVLTLGELEAGFVVCMVPLVLSLFVFLIEWTPTLKDLTVFLFISKTFFEVKKCEQKNHFELMKAKIAATKAMLQKNNKFNDYQ